MKKFSFVIAMALVVSTAFGCLAVPAYADENSAAVGNFLRASQMRRQANGTQKQDIYIAKRFGFDKIKSICYFVRVPDEAAQYVDDNYITQKTNDIIYDKFEKSNVKFISSVDAASKFKTLPENAGFSKEQLVSKFIAWVAQNYSATLYVDVIAYRQGNVADVIMDYTVRENGNGQVIFNDRDTRINVSSSGRDKLLEKTVEKFKSELLKNIEKQ